MSDAQNNTSATAGRPSSAALFSLISLMLVGWAFNFLAAKFGLLRLDAATLASFRVVSAGLICLPLFWLTGSHEPRPKRRDLWTFAYLGLFGVALNQTCFTIGLKYTTVGHSALIIAMGPIFVLLLARLQGLEHITWRKAVGMMISFVGVAILASERGLSFRSGTLLGDLITLAGSWAFTLYAVLGKKVAAQYDSVTMTCYNHFVGALIVLPLALAEIVRISRAGGWSSIGWQGWTAVLYMAAVGSVLAYLIFYWALRHMAASRLSSLGYVNPLLATVLGILLLPEERFTRPLLFGGALILAGVWVTEHAPRDTDETRPATPGLGTD